MGASQFCKNKGTNVKIRHSCKEKQSVVLNLESNQRTSPYLTECCLRVIANVSYENAAQDIARYTGVCIAINKLDSERALQVFCKD